GEVGVVSSFWTPSLVRLFPQALYPKSIPYELGGFGYRDVSFGPRRRKGKVHFFLTGDVAGLFRAFGSGEPKSTRALSGMDRHGPTTQRPVLLDGGQHSDFHVPDQVLECRFPIVSKRIPHGLPLC